MTAEGPILESLTRRLAECPAEFLEAPLINGAGVIDVAAIVADHLRSLGATPPRGTKAETFRVAPNPLALNRLRLIAVAVWLLHDAWFLARPDLAPAVAALLTRGLDELSGVARADDAVNDPDRREELARVCLRALGLRPAGESEAQATDRLTSLDSAERERVIRRTRAAEARAREIREAMKKKAAAEAAARYTPE